MNMLHTSPKSHCSSPAEDSVPLSYRFCSLSLCVCAFIPRGLIGLKAGYMFYVAVCIQQASHPPAVPQIYPHDHASAGLENCFSHFLEV